MLLAPVLLHAAGCCGLTPPEPEKFFDRRESPIETLKGFVYSVDTHQWDYAHACLAESARKEIGPIKLEVGLRFLKDPVFHQISMFDIISDSVRHRGPPRYDGRDVSLATRAWIRVIPGVLDEDGKPVHFEAKLFFLKEEGEWRLDFLESLNEIQRMMSVPAEDVSDSWLLRNFLTRRVADHGIARDGKGSPACLAVRALPRGACLTGQAE